MKNKYLGTGFGSVLPAIVLVFGLVLMGCTFKNDTPPIGATISLSDGAAGDNQVVLTLSGASWSSHGASWVDRSWFTYSAPDLGISARAERTSDTVLTVIFSKLGEAYDGTVAIKSGWLDVMSGALSDNKKSLGLGANTPVRISMPANMAQTPSITLQPQGAGYHPGALAERITIDANVTDGGTLTHSWYKNTKNSTVGGTFLGSIVVAKGSYYIPTILSKVTDDVVTYYYVVVTNNKSGTGSASVTSDIAAITVTNSIIVDAKEPIITAQPVDKSYMAGNTARALEVTANSTDSGTLSYQWFYNTINSTTEGTPTTVGSNSSSFLPRTDSLYTLYYYVVVTNTNSRANGAKTAMVTSNTAKVTVSKAPLTGTVRIGGEAVVGQTLAAFTPLLGGIGAITYKWMHGDSEVEIGADATYKVTSADLGKTIKVTVTRSLCIGEVTSAETAAVVLPTLTGTVSINGSAAVGWTLSANTGSLQGTGAISYEWKRGSTAQAAGTGISGATAAVYTLTAADIDKYISVTVGRAGYSGSITSEPIAALEYLPSTGVSLNKLTASQVVGHTETLTATVSPAAAKQAVTWSSSNPSIATVVDGVVTAVRAGSAVITAKTVDGSNKTASCSFTALPALTENVWADGMLEKIIRPDQNPASNAFYEINKQLFYFTATAETQYIHVKFGTLSGAPDMGGLFVKVYDSNESLLWGDRLTNRSRTIALPLTVGSVYRIEVRNCEYDRLSVNSLHIHTTYAHSSGTYQIAFGGGIPPGTDFRHITASNNWENGTLAEFGVDWFKFTATAAKQYIHAYCYGALSGDSQFGGSSKGGIRVTVYDRSGTRVGGTHIYSALTDPSSTLLTLSVGSEYYIEVIPAHGFYFTTYRDAYTGGGTYRIAFGGVVPPGTSVTQIPTENTWVPGYLTSTGEQWFRFTATSATHFIHTGGFTGTLSAVSVQMYDNAGNSVGGTLSRTLTPGSEYYVRVRPSSGTSYPGNSYSGTYRIAFGGVVPPGTSVTQIPTENTWVPGNLTSTGDQWFRFTATSVEQFILGEFNGSLDGSKGVIVTVYNNASYSVSSSSGYSYLDTGNPSTSYPLTIGDEYYVRVRPYSSSNGTYRIKFSASDTP
ncbi:MAG: hypothetical protein Ta2A_14960 [Treponemataceae bacterium]|nr:MAG: hypothetical protein Ta2A_14960 [Treponemataceae bacterium]